MRARIKAVIAWLRALARMVGALFGLRDVFLFGGLMCVARGAWLMYPPAAWLIVGAILIMLALRKGAVE